MRIFNVIILLIALLAVTVEHGLAAAPTTLNYQGMLQDSNNDPVTGSHTITFRLYGENGASFWTEEQAVSLDLSGRFSVTLGSDNDNTLDPADFTGTTSIGIQVGTEPELAPPQQLTSVAYAVKAGNGNPVGTILEFAGATAPEGYLLCDGAEVLRDTYAGLFAVIGTIYGLGDGSTTFNVPDKRNRTSFGAGDAYNLGDEVGSATKTITIANMPSHNHTATINPDGSHTHGLYIQDNGGSTWGVLQGHQGSYGTPHIRNTTSAGNHSHVITMNNTGSGVPINVLNPGIITNFIVKY